MVQGDGFLVVAASPQVEKQIKSKWDEMKTGVPP